MKKSRLKQLLTKTAEVGAMQSLNVPPNFPRSHPDDGEVEPTDGSAGLELRPRSGAAVSYLATKAQMKVEALEEKLNNLQENLVGFYVPIESIQEYSRKFRIHFDECSIELLSASIRAYGICETLAVRPHPEQDGKFILLSGERRLIAARRAGLTKVPVRVLMVDEKEAANIALSLGLVAEALTDFELARGLDSVASFCQNDIKNTWIPGTTYQKIEELLSFKKLPVQIRADLEQNPSLIKAKDVEEILEIFAENERRNIEFEKFWLLLKNHLSQRELFVSVPE